MSDGLWRGEGGGGVGQIRLQGFNPWTNLICIKYWLLVCHIIDTRNVGNDPSSCLNSSKKTQRNGFQRCGQILRGAFERFSRALVLWAYSLLHFVLGCSTLLSDAYQFTNLIFVRSDIIIAGLWLALLVVWEFLVFIRGNRYVRQKRFLVRFASIALCIDTTLWSPSLFTINVRSSTFMTWREPLLFAP